MLIFQSSVFLCLDCYLAKKVSSIFFFALLPFAVFSQQMEKKKCKGLAISSSRNWANMEYEVLVYIFMKLSTMDLLSSISLVCHSWRAACCNPLLWFTLDLARLKYSFDCPMDLGALLHSWQSTRLMQILNSALILGGNNIMCLIFHFDAHIKDEHLIFAAERFCFLLSLHVANLPYRKREKKKKEESI